jgi:hypothetical protein
LLIILGAVVAAPSTSSFANEGDEPPAISWILPKRAQIARFPRGQLPTRTRLSPGISSTDAARPAVLKIVVSPVPSPGLVVWVAPRPPWPAPPYRGGADARSPARSASRAGADSVHRGRWDC